MVCKKSFSFIQLIILAPKKLVHENALYFATTPTISTFFSFEIELSIDCSTGVATSVGEQHYVYKKAKSGSDKVRKSKHVFCY